MPRVDTALARSNCFGFQLRYVSPFKPKCYNYHNQVKAFSLTCPNTFFILTEARGTLMVDRGKHPCGTYEKNTYHRLFILFLAMYYVIQVKTGKEKETMEDIFKHQRGDFHLEVFLPCRKTMRKYKGVYKEVTERCFPGYLFVETNDVEQLFKDLYWVPGYTRLLGREGMTYNFVPLNQEESRMIDILYNADCGRVTPISDIEVREGDQVRILTGPLKDIKGMILKTNLHKRNVMIGFSLCGSYVEVKVGVNIISRQAIASSSG